MSMNDYKKGMGERLKKHRKELHFTQEEIAEKLGISVKHYSEVERGLTGLSIENLIKLSTILGISIDYIIKGDCNYNKWSSTLALLDQTPAKKENQLKEIIHHLVEFSQEI